MRTISILNFKGGVGKTTVATNLAETFSRAGKRVLIIEADSQRNSSSILPDYERDVEYSPSLRDVLKGEARLEAAIRQARPNLFIVPSHTDIDETTVHIAQGGIKTFKLVRNAVQRLQGYDFVLFDHSPSYSKVTGSLLLASSEILIPVEFEHFSIEGLLLMMDKVTRELDELEHEVSITGYIPNKLDYARGMTQRYLRDMKDAFGTLVTTPIRRDEAIRKAQEKGQTIYEYDRRSKGAKDFEALATFLLSTEEVTA